MPRLPSLAEPAGRPGPAPGPCSRPCSGPRVARRREHRGRSSAGAGPRLLPAAARARLAGGHSRAQRLCCLRVSQVHTGPGLAWQPGNLFQSRLPSPHMPLPPPEPGPEPIPGCTAPAPSPVGRHVVGVKGKGERERRREKIGGLKSIFILPLRP